MNLQEAQKEIQTKMAEMQKELENVGRDLFKEGSGSLFAEFPQVESFSWTQYTPYFNDGDECIFGVNDYFNVKLDNGDELEDVCDSPYYRQRKEEAGEPLNLEDQLGMALGGLINAVPQETMKSLFGDHVRVTVTREGITTDEYEHD